jgi:hypothetical protein
MKKHFLLLLFAITCVLLSAQKSFDKVITMKHARAKGYCGWVEAGGNIYFIKDVTTIAPHPYPAFRMFHGARLSPRVMLGAEVGLDPFSQIPINAKVRVNILKQRFTPFVDFSAGYSFVFMNYNTHGFNLSPSVGFKVWGKKGMAAFTFRTGYCGLIYAIPKEMRDGNQPRVRRIEHHHGITLMGGVEF